MKRRPERNLTPAIPFVVLGTLPLGERDALLRIVEPRGGTLSVVLRNARSGSKGSSPWRTLDLFDRASGSLSIRPARMPTLTSFDRLPSFGSLRTDLTKFAAASALAESTLVLFSEQSEATAQLYETVTHYLAAIDAATSPRETLKVLTLSLIALLVLSGFGLLEGETERSAARDSLPTTESQHPPRKPTPRLLRHAIAAIEKATNKELRTGPTIARILADLPARG